MPPENLEHLTKCGWRQVNPRISGKATASRAFCSTVFDWGAIALRIQVYGAIVRRAIFSPPKRRRPAAGGSRRASTERLRIGNCAASKRKEAERTRVASRPFNWCVGSGCRIGGKSARLHGPVGMSLSPSQAPATVTSRWALAISGFLTHVRNEKHTGCQSRGDFSVPGRSATANSWLLEKLRPSKNLLSPFPSDGYGTPAACKPYIRGDIE